MGSWPGIRLDVQPGVTAAVRPDVRPAERPAGRLAGPSWAAPVSSAVPKKKHLIEAAPFGRLDQMLRTGRCPPQLKIGGSGGQCPPGKIFVGP